MHEIAVIIPTFNRVDFLMEAIRSVQNQTFNSITLHVVDNGSTDATVETLVRESISHSVEKGGRAGAARMDGVGRTTEPFLLFLDDDDHLYPPALSTLYTQITETGADLCYGSMREFGQASAVRPLAPLASSTLVRRTVFNRVGDFEPSNFSWIEWMARVRSLEIRTAVVDQVVAGRRVHDSNMGREQSGMKPYFEILRAKLNQEPNH
jgi:glycosyltransferase involved in cell wall biosynthesis